MEQNYLTRAAKYLADLRRRKTWKKIVSGLGTVVVFCTVYALILPAITMTRPAICGMEEHHHDEGCYTMVSPIAATVQLPQQVCTVESVYADLEPGVAHAGFVLHVHDESCYQDGQLICTLAEIAPHVHDTSCYETVPGQLICGYGAAPGTEQPPEVPGPGTEQPPEVPGPGTEPPPAENMVPHVHTDACYAYTNVLVCGLEEGEGAAQGHAHTDDCYAMEPVQKLVCGIAEEDHEHTDVCYVTEMARGELTCGQMETPAIEGHRHTEACYQAAQQITCGKQEGELEPAVTGLDDPEVPLAEGMEEILGGSQETVQPHVHDETCYGPSQEVLTCENEYTPHEHEAACYDVDGSLICGRVVTRVHVHTAECFQQGGDLELIPTLSCGKEEHEHTETCYESGPDRAEQEQRWGALFWSGIVSESSDTVMSAETTASWMNTGDIPTEALEALYNAPAADLTRFLDSNVGIWINEHSYSYGVDGPMDPEGEFGILLSWSLSAANFAVETTTATVPAAPVETIQPDYSGDPALALLSAGEPVTTTTATATGTLTYSYRFPDSVVVADIEKRVLNDMNTGAAALSYFVQNNTLTVTYYAPAENVQTSFHLKAAWAGDVGESVRVQWSNGVFNDVEFASPELTVEKSMGENGLRVEEDGTVWADYSVTVTNTGVVGAKGVTLTDTLESEHFRFYRGGAAGGTADYSVTTTSLNAEGVESAGAETFETFPVDYDGGNTLRFPEFDLAAGESRVFRYTAQMSAEEREAVDEVILAEAEQLPQGQRPGGVTVSNTAVVTCPGSKTPEYTAKAQATYGGPDSKHIDGYTYEYPAESGMFDVTFTVNGDAILPPGITNEVLEARNGGYRLIVNELGEEDEAYQAFVQFVAESQGTEGSIEDEENLLDLSVLDLELRYNGVKLDLSDCDVTATVTPSEMLKNYREPLSVTYGAERDEDEESAGFSIELAAFSTSDEQKVDALAPVETQPEETYEKEGAVVLDVSTETGTTANEGAVEDIAPITFAVRNGRLATSTAVNPYPEYEVEFYANLDVLDWQATAIPKKTIPIIDTSGRILPGNTEQKSVQEPPAGTPLRYLELSDNTVGKPSTFNTKKELTQIFTNRTRQYNPKVSLSLTMLDNIKYDVTSKGTTEIKDPHYKLKEVWVLQAGGNAADESSWEKYNKDDLPKDDKDTTSKVKFTNSATEKESNPSGYILVTAGTKLRMVYDPESGSHTNEVNFYDYDISSGGNRLDAYGNGKGNGINSKTGEGIKFAFGNNNVGSPFGTLQWHGNLLNKFNITKADGPRSVGTFHGNTFGLVKKNLENGNIQFQDDLLVPSLFNEGTETGKTSYDANQYKLRFSRSGDTYTMSDVLYNDGYAQRYNSDGDMCNMSGLNNLVIIAQEQYTMGVPVPTNSFWPMDNAASAGTGSNEHDILFGQKNEKIPIVGAGGNQDIDLNSDDKAKHNSYFGMQFAFKFNLPEGYVGPLDYVFFGDDDLWLFLDGNLVCDLGGVKSSTCGEYVNLADYIGKVDDPTSKYNGAYEAGEHILQLFYLERGATGSTCWMQFTIPNITSVPLDQTPDGTKGSLRIYKEVSGAVDMDQVYGFTLTIDDVSDIFSVKKYDKDLNEVEIDATATGVYDFGLKAGESLAVFDLPKGKHFTITEQSDPNNNFTTTIKSSDRENVVDGGKIEGTSEADTTITVTYTNTFHYTLPETGGPGTGARIWYTYGALPAMAAAVVLYKRSRKKGGTVS